MSVPTTTTLRLTVELDVEGDPDVMEDQFVSYVTDPMNPFLVDYGPGTWGGYDGPIVHNVRVDRQGDPHT